MAPLPHRRRPQLHGIVLFLLGLGLATASGVHGGTWCVARSDATQQALQRALDYACGSGADCAPVQSEGLCYLPNTLPGHASYAFNSYYQRKAMAPGSCDFSGTATVAASDPSYGSCVYPSSLSTAGGTPSTGIGTPSVPSTGSLTPTTSGIPTLPTGATLTPPTPFYGGSIGGAPYSGSVVLSRFSASRIIALTVPLLAVAV